MTVLELNDLVKAVEAEFGVTAASAPAQPSVVEDEGPVDKGPSEVTLVLKHWGASKVAVIKVVQSITGLGLMDAKKLVDGAPVNIKEKNLTRSKLKNTRKLLWKRVLKLKLNSLKKSSVKNPQLWLWVFVHIKEDPLEPLL